MNMRNIFDGDSQVLWISPKQNNGDWDFYYFMRLQYMDEYLSESEVKEFGKYCVEIHVVSAEAAGEDKVKQAFDSCGMADINVNLSPGALEEYKAQALMEYGISACLFSKAGNSKSMLLKLAKEELKKMSMLFGFYMDRRCNSIGNTGWDFIAGNIGFNK